MRLVYLIDIFEDNHNIVNDRFETDLLNVTKKQDAYCKETQENFNIYQLGSVTSENHGNGQQEQ